MESTIKWQTGKPKEEGLYIVTTLGGNVCIDEYYNKCGWVRIKEVCIVAWCKLSDIEPYKDKEEQQ